MQAKIKGGADVSTAVLTPGKHGRPLLLPQEVDSIVGRLVQNLHAAGTPVSFAIVRAAARGIVTHKNPASLKEFGGSIYLSKSWTQSFLQWMGYVKRKGTAHHAPSNFEDVREEFLDICKQAADGIDASMIVNFDQTGTKMVLVSQWTMESEGSKQVDLIGLDDKRGITVLLGVSLAGDVLPPQVIYTGKMARCHPKVQVPPGWNVTHSDNHWSTKKTMVEFADMVLGPYMDKQQERQQLESTSPGL